MAYLTGSLLYDAWRKLQFHARFTRTMRLAGLNRGIEQLILWGSEDDDIQELDWPVDSDGSPVREIPLPSLALKVSGVSWDDYPLTAASLDMYMNSFAKRFSSGGPPSYYYIRKNLYLDIFPRGDASRKVRLFGVFKPPDVLLDTDPVPLARQYSDALVSYMCWWCTDGLKGQEEQGRCAQFLAEYKEQRGLMRFNINQNTVSRIRRTH